MPLDKWPVPRGRNWIDFVNDPETEAELKALRRSVRRGKPFGATVWQQDTAK
jgi:putative transposase